MVNRVGEKKTVGDGYTTMKPKRSPPLHNFQLSSLQWGNQKLLRCVKVESDDGSDQILRRRSSPSNFEESASLVIRSPRRGSEHRLRERQRCFSKTAPTGLIIDDEEDGIDAVRKKIMLDLKTEADKMKESILGEEVAGDDEDKKEEALERAKEKKSKQREKDEPSTASGDADDSRPWNLRMRRSAAPVNDTEKTSVTPAITVNNNRGMRTEEKKVSYLPWSDVRKSPLGRDKTGLVEQVEQVKKERAKFSVYPSKQEIEQDFMAMVGHRPARRPKKRPRAVQKEIDCLFPGLWLTEITADDYKVPDLPANRKRKR